MYRDLGVQTHGPNCGCSVCAPQNLQSQERINSTGRITWLEEKVHQLEQQIYAITKGQNSMGYALWCQKGQHSFDENDPEAERMTVDKRDPETGKKTGEEMTVHMCGRHAKEAFQPIKRSLKEITAEIDAAEEIGD